MIFTLGCVNVESDWQKAESEAKVSSNIDVKIKSYKNFLTRHSNGPFADKAHLILEELLFKKATYEAASYDNKGRVICYQNFLKEYPAGAFADKVRLILQQLSFKIARETNTADSYEEFLNKYPEGKLADEARLILGKSVRVILRESYTNRDKEVLQSFGERNLRPGEWGYGRGPWGNDRSSTIRIAYSVLEERIIEFLKCAGFAWARSDDPKCYATLTVTAEGGVLGALYGRTSSPFEAQMFKSGVVPGTSRFYNTGAFLKGSIILAVMGRGEYTGPFQGRQEIRSHITVGENKTYWQSDEELLKEAFNTCQFEEHLIKTFERAFGIQLLIESLKNVIFHLHIAEISSGDAEIISGDLPAGEPAPAPPPTPPPNESAILIYDGIINILKSKNERKTIDLLITALEHKNRYIRAEIFKLLREMTGQQFPEDIQKWNEWWQKNKSKYYARNSR